MIDRINLSRWGVGVILALLSSGYAAAEIEFPAASPAVVVQQRIGLTDFELSYSRPSVKGREIFGGLQAFGEVWRTGANAATKISFDSEVRFGDRPVEAGTYALFTIPRETSWTVILNREADQWGATRYNADEDVVRIDVPMETVPDLVESLRIDFNELRDESAVLEIAWEHSRVRVPIAVDVRGRLQPQIEAAMGSGQKQPDFIYFQAANYYYDHDIDLSLAAEWIDEALAQNSRAFWMFHLKAKIHAKLGNVEEAIAAAEQSTALAVAAEGASSGYKVMNDALIASLR